MPDRKPIEQELCSSTIADGLRAFREFGGETSETVTTVTPDGVSMLDVPTFTNEFWTPAQRAAHSLHEISYRACFKPQLARFFIDRLTREGDVVYDPFMGRGTTPLEAALLGRVPFGNDINPLSRILLKPRFSPPAIDEVAGRLDTICWTRDVDAPNELLVFYHPETLQQICALRAYLIEREEAGELDALDEWIRMVAVNRLTGHSPGFFSVYTMPPNQAVSVQSQRKINERRDQQPPPRNVPELILKKTRSLMRGCKGQSMDALAEAGRQAMLLCRPANETPEIADETVQLVVTSPPFLDVVDYAGDNWLRCWFCGIDADSVPISVPAKLADWQAMIGEVFGELARILRPGGCVAFEVGEVRGGKIKLEESVIPCGAAAGLEPQCVMINDQAFTKTAHCWGVTNQSKGTNTNRIVVFRKS